MSKRHLDPAHLSLIKSLAHQYKSKITDDIDYDDLAQSGMVGLLEALSAFDPTRNANFESFVYSRICNAMQKEIHNGDWTPQQYYKTLRKSFEAREKIESVTGKNANDVDVAKEMKMSVKEYNKFIGLYQTSRLLNFDEYEYSQGFYEHDEMVQLNIFSDVHLSPIDKCNIDNVREWLTKAIDKLSQREKFVLSLYYDEELRMKTIGNILDVSESRICQIHKNALTYLRKLFIH